MRRLKRIGVVLCAVAMLCQFLILPAYADEAPVETIGATEAPLGASPIEGGYNWYASKLPDTLAKQSIEVKPCHL